MTTRRSIFKCIPAMIAAAVLPKSWTARASEPEFVVSVIRPPLDFIPFDEAVPYVQPAPPLVLVSETGPEFIMPVSGTIKRMTWSLDGPIRIYVDDQYGGTTELSRAISAEFTVK